MDSFHLSPYVGLMSGTSCDGVDGVVSMFHEDLPHRVELLAQVHLPFDDGLRRRLHRLQEPNFLSTEDPFDLAATTANDLVDVYVQAVEQLCRSANLLPKDIQAIGCHGQTIRHRPDRGYSLQLNNAARLVEKTGIPVIADWRARDIAAGGQGAPLVPAFHRWLFDVPGQHRVIVNLGGIANITDLATGIAFDCGPANTLIDSWAMVNLNRPIDDGGRWAQSGSCLDDLLAAMLGDPFFALPPPKSTGRDHFCLGWIKKHLTGSEHPQDVQATLTELTAVTVAEAIACLPRTPTEIFLCGGGIYNDALIDALARRLAVELQTTEALGLAPLSVEATAFAWLARQTQQHRPGNLPAATGAVAPRCLGAVYFA